MYCVHSQDEEDEREDALAEGAVSSPKGRRKKAPAKAAKAAAAKQAPAAKPAAKPDVKVCWSGVAAPIGAHTLRMDLGLVLPVLPEAFCAATYAVDMSSRQLPGRL